MNQKPSENRPLIITMLSPRHEFAYRFHDALASIPNIKKRYRFLSMPYNSTTDPVPDIQRFNPAGIITSIGADSVDSQPIADFGIPVVNISLSERDGFMSLFVDPNSTAEMVIRHALGTRFKKLTYLSIACMSGQIQIQGELLKKHALKANMDFIHQTIHHFESKMTLPEWMDKNADFITHLKKENQRTLYFTGYDELADHLLRLMKHLDIPVPQSAGILGRGNLNNSKLSDPGISTLKWPWVNLANTAIEMLKKPSGDRRIPSGEVLIRESTTQIDHHENQWVFKVADMIERYGYEGLTPDQLAGFANVSKSTLERRYREIYATTPSVAIRKVQMRKALSLLRDSDMTIEGIAHSVGFKAARSFFRAFETEHGMTPTTWRKTQR